MRLHSSRCGKLKYTIWRSVVQTEQLLAEDRARFAVGPCSPSRHDHIEHAGMGPGVRGLAFTS